MRLIHPAKVAGTFRSAVRCSKLSMIPGERHMECAYYFDFCPRRDRLAAAIMPGMLADSITIVASSARLKSIAYRIESHPKCQPNDSAK